MAVTEWPCSSSLLDDAERKRRPLLLAVFALFSLERLGELVLCLPSSLVVETY